jgi:hypothetical protein
MGQRWDIPVQGRRKGKHVLTVRRMPRRAIRSLTIVYRGKTHILNYDHDKDCFWFNLDAKGR